MEAFMNTMATAYGVLRLPGVVMRCKCPTHGGLNLRTVRYVAKVSPTDALYSGVSLIGSCYKGQTSEMRQVPFLAVL
jgi:hypothetical protein